MFRRGLAQTLTFVAVDSSAPPARKSGLAFASGDVKVGKDGGAFANTTNVPAEIGVTGIYSLALTAAETDCLWLHVSATKTGMQPVDLTGATSGQPSGAVAAGANTTTNFITNLTSGTNDFWKDALLVFTTGALAGQVKKIAAYDGGTKAITLAGPFTGTPADGDQFLLVNI